MKNTQNSSASEQVPSLESRQLLERWLEGRAEGTCLFCCPHLGTGTWVAHPWLASSGLSCLPLCWEDFRDHIPLLPVLKGDAAFPGKGSS